ncbi:MAG: Asp-tRNA(Asn)/Glu-tRNA(Gln) amidotransferase subunit GatA [Candidatus Melainabacteria bacterium]|nr:Asp-tRNA(Asn)/Glu-tRNA(Gln) amidotransferase subunit GatA [Candidatus Melainabacteria bacterium]
MATATHHTVLSETALGLHQQIVAGTRSAASVLEETYATLAQREPEVQAFLSLTRPLAEATAAEVDRRVAAGEPLPLLAGVPIAIKDNINVTGYPTTCASRILQGYVSPYNATVIERTQAHLMPIVGKTNLDEFAMGSSSENSAFQPTRNPWDPERVPGGSSSGSAAAVSAGIVPLSLGSDTGGSVRQPAALCGLVGIKPTYGLVSRYGLVAYGSSLDQVSPFARNVADAAALLQIIAGHDPLDATSLPDEAPLAYVNQINVAPQPLTIGIIEQFEQTSGMQAEVQEAIRQTLQTLEAMGHRTVRVSIPSIEKAIAAYYILATAEASSNLARYDGVRYGRRPETNVRDVYELFRETRAAGFGPEVKRRIMLGTFALSAGYYDAFYGKGQKARALLWQEFSTAFAQADVLVCPTTPTTAFRFGEKTADPVSMYLSDIATIPANLTGIPALSVPCGFDHAGLPIGLQLMAPHRAESQLFRLAQQLETQTGLANLLPARLIPTTAATV